jgi:hypothetical protein
VAAEDRHARVLDVPPQLEQSAADPATIPGLSRPIAVTAYSLKGRERWRDRHAPKIRRLVTREEILERERRWALPAAIAAFLVPVIFIVGAIVGQSAGLESDASEAESLRVFDTESGTLLISRLLQAVSLALVAAPLLYLFRAAQARSEAVRGALVGVVIAGPLFLAAGAVLGWFALNDVAADFVASDGAACAEFDPGSTEEDDCVQDLINDNSAFGVAQGLQLAGTLGLLAGLVYTSLHAMRTGLLTRFFGSLGMALGVSVIFLGPLGVIVFSLALGLLILGRWPGGRPPAWDEGRAIPWPRPGEAPRDTGTVEGRGEEHPPAGGAEADSGETAEGEPAPTAPRRKRKRRS